jgi:predicted deacylase
VARRVHGGRTEVDVKQAKRESFVLGKTEVAPGARGRADLQIGELYDRSPLGIAVHVLHGAYPGPTLFVSAGIHGDELLGFVVVRRVLEKLDPAAISGTVLAIPFVNHLGLLHGTRELPDGRDLNRSFPGSKNGSLAARFARSFLREIAMRCTHGIDLHTAGMHRDNLPQIRADLADPETMRLARAFGAPIIIHAGLRDGSLRQAAGARGVSTLLYEAGEPLRHDEDCVRVGFEGVMRVMTALGMVDRRLYKVSTPLVSWGTAWVRSPRSGYFIPSVDLGDRVRRGAAIGALEMRAGPGEVSDRLVVNSRGAGLVIGITRNPLVHVGDPLVHVADLGARSSATSERVAADMLVPDEE